MSSSVLPSPPIALPSPAPQLKVTWGTRALRCFFRSVGRISPRLGARLAEALFVRTTRPALRARDEAFLRRSRTFRVRARGKTLQGYRWGDDGPLLLCVHGWGSHAGRFVFFTEAALRAGYSVVAFDGPGHGRSAGWRATMPEFAEAIGEVINEVGPVHGIVGHSLGGSATLFALSRGAEAQRAAIIGAPADVTRWLLHFRDFMRLPRPLFVRLRRNLERRLGVTWDELGLPAVAAGLAVPGLVIHDRDDKDVPWEDGAALAASWPGAEFVTTEGLGHRLVMRDDAVIGQLIDFFDAKAA